MGHLGLTPQSIYKFGTYTVRAKEEEEAKQLLADAKYLEKIGCFAIVLEKVPSSLAEKVTKEIKIPIISDNLFTTKSRVKLMIFFIFISTDSNLPLCII